MDYELPNGLKVTLVPFGTVPKTTIVVAVSTGAIAEGTRPGLASMAAELMKQGVGGGDASQLFRRAADLGGAVGITAGHASFSIGIDVLSEHGSEALDLLAQIIRHPTLPAQELPRLKADAKRALAISRSQQQSIAGHALSHRLFGSDDPRGHQLEDHEVDAGSGRGGQALERGVNIVVGTPGRIIDYYKQHVFELRETQAVVLDEVKGEVARRA